MRNPISCCGLGSCVATHVLRIMTLQEEQTYQLNFKSHQVIEQEAQGLGAMLDKMEDNDHINWITQRSRCIFHSKNCRF